MAKLIQTLISGLSLGSIYALIALGYTMVYGIAKMLNFAHGDIIMVGAYAVITSVAAMNLPPLVAVLISILVCVILGVTIEFLAYRPLRQAPPLAVLITAIGVSYFLQNMAQLIFGTEQKAFPTILKLPTLYIGQVSIDGITLATLVVTAVIMLALSLFISKSRMGKAMRAVSEDMGAAQLMGISLNRTISFTFAIGSALAGIGSVLYLCAYQQASPTMGSMLGLKAFVAAVLGGIGSIPGAMIGGFAIGLLEALVSAVGLSIWKDGVVFAILIVVLLVKPTGILGRPQTEKV